MAAKKKTSNKSPLVGTVTKPITLDQTTKLDIDTDKKLLEELRQKYTKNPPEGMTAALVKNMTDSDLLDMHYFLIEDDDLDDDDFEEGFYVF